MAKRNILLGTASGKLGDIVFSRRNGEQIISTRVTPANPKSEAQSRQRMAFATATSAASRLRQIIDHSFEGVKYGQDSVNHFVKLNIKALRAAAAYNGEELPEGSYNDFLIKGVKGVARMPFVVSEGRLNFPNGTLAVNQFGDTGLAVPVYNQDPWLIDVENAESYETALAGLGLIPGDQLTLLAVVTDGNSIGSYDPTGAYNTTSYVEFARIVFKKSSEIDFGAITIGELISESGVISPQFINFERSSEWVGGVNVTNEPVGSDDYAVFAPVISNPALILKMAAVIRSQRGENGWLRSSNKFAVADDQNATADMVWPSYANQSAELVSDRYLNQATNNVGSTGTSQVAKAPFILSFSAVQSASTLTISQVRYSNIPSGTRKIISVYAADGSLIQMLNTTNIEDSTTAVTIPPTTATQTLRVVVASFGASRSQSVNWTQPE